MQVELFTCVGLPPRARPPGAKQSRRPATCPSLRTVGEWSACSPARSGPRWGRPGHAGQGAPREALEP
eukprot:5087019-Alexandrium_andersonii.AAC.1